MEKREPAYHSYELSDFGLRSDGRDSLSHDARAEMPEVGQVLHNVVFEIQGTRRDDKRLVSKNVYGRKGYVLVLDRSGLDIKQVAGKPCRVEVTKDLSEGLNRRREDHPKFLCQLLKKYE